MTWSDPEIRAAVFTFILVGWSFLQLCKAYTYSLQSWPGKGLPDDPLHIILPTIGVFGLIKALESGLDSILPALRPFEYAPEILGVGFAVLADELGLQPISRTSFSDNISYILTAQYALEGFVSLLLFIRMRHFFYQRSMRRKAK